MEGRLEGVTGCDGLKGEEVAGRRAVVLGSLALVSRILFTAFIASSMFSSRVSSSSITPS